MKIIQSFWTGKKELSNTFGWVSAKHHYLGWILSVNQLRRYYDEVELFTDKKGFDMLINTLKLPYTKVHVVMDTLNNYNPNLWALSKIKAYSLMEDPFLHVDGDVFIWEPFPKDLLASHLITQNLECTSAYYRDMWASIRPKLSHCSSYMENFDQGKANHAFNMGIFGGHDLSFIKKYTEESFAFVDQNISKLGDINLGNFNIFFEQVLFHEMTIAFNKNVNVLITESIGDNEYKGFGSFDDVPTSRTYLHLLGFFKRQTEVCRKLETYVLKYYPKYYKRLESYFHTKPIPNYRYSLKNNKELINTYHKNLVNKNSDDTISDKRILSRNIFMEGQLTKFHNFEKSTMPFVITSTSDFEIEYENGDAKQILIRELNNERFTVPFLNIDYILFNQLDEGPFTKEILNRNAFKYLSKGFPEMEKQNVINTLWKRITYLISVGVLVALPNTHNPHNNTSLKNTLISG